MKMTSNEVIEILRFEQGRNLKMSALLKSLGRENAAEDYLKRSVAFETAADALDGGSGDG